MPNVFSGVLGVDWKHFVLQIICYLYSSMVLRRLRFSSNEAKGYVVIFDIQTVDIYTSYAVQLQTLISIFKRRFQYWWSFVISILRLPSFYMKLLPDNGPVSPPGKMSDDCPTCILNNCNLSLISMLYMNEFCIRDRFQCCLFCSFSLTRPLKLSRTDVICKHLDI